MSDPVVVAKIFLASEFHDQGYRVQFGCRIDDDFKLRFLNITREDDGPIDVRLPTAEWTARANEELARWREAAAT